MKDADDILQRRNPLKFNKTIKSETPENYILSDKYDVINKRCAFHLNKKEARSQY